MFGYSRLSKIPGNGALNLKLARRRRRKLLEQPVTRPCYYAKIFLFLVVVSGWAKPAASYEVWLSAMSNARQDYVTMFERTSEWPRVASSARVFQVHVGVLQRLSDNRLSYLLTLLRKHKLKLALLTPILPPVEGCPLDEAFFYSEANHEALRVKRLGGVVDYISFDEPIWFGNQKREGQNCSMSLEQLARAASPAVRELAQLFPSAKFGDVEPTSVSAGSILLFRDRLAQASSVIFSFVHADVLWGSEWQLTLVDWRQTFAQAGLVYGIIIDGGGAEGQDRDWSELAVERYRSIPKEALEQDDDLVFMSWQRAPQAYYPETFPETMTAVINRILDLSLK